jgi:hypothetical protein
MAIQAQNFTTTPVEPKQPQQVKRAAPKVMKMDNMGNVETPDAATPKEVQAQPDGTIVPAEPAVTQDEVVQYTGPTKAVESGHIPDPPLTMDAFPEYVPLNLWGGLSEEGAKADFFRHWQKLGMAPADIEAHWESTKEAMYKQAQDHKNAWAEAKADWEFRKADVQLKDWEAKAEGEGLDDTAAQQQLAENVARARDNTQDQLSGFGGRQSARAANIGATMDARQQAEASRAEDLLRAQEQQYYQQLAGELGSTLQQELANADFADADMRARMAEVYNNAMNSAKDISNSLEVADLMAEAQRKMAEDQASAGWTSTIIGGAFSGAATGFAVGGPWGALAGAGVGAGAGIAGKYFSGN